MCIRDRRGGTSARGGDCGDGEAARRGDTEGVKALIAAGHADVNYANVHGKTALMMAAHEGHVPLLRCLLGAGAGNVLTKLTNWKAVLLLVLCLLLSLPFMRPSDLSDQLGQGGAPTTNTNAAPAQPAPSPIKQAPSPTPSAPVTPTEEPSDTATNTPSVTPEAPAENKEDSESE